MSQASLLKIEALLNNVDEAELCMLTRTIEDVRLVRTAASDEEADALLAEKYGYETDAPAVELSDTQKQVVDALVSAPPPKQLN